MLIQSEGKETTIVATLTVQEAQAQLEDLVHRLVPETKLS